MTDRAAIVAEIRSRHAAGESYATISESKGKGRSWAWLTVNYKPSGNRPGRIPNREAPVKFQFRRMVTAFEAVELDGLLDRLRGEGGRDGQ